MEYLKNYDSEVLYLSDIEKSMKIRTPLLLVTAGLFVVLILYFVLTKPPDVNNVIKTGSFADYQFVFQSGNSNGTPVYGIYRWKVLSVTGDIATINEQIEVSFKMQNYTSYLNSSTGVITRERSTANGTVKESLCFMMINPESISDCTYYTPLQIEGDENVDNRLGVKVVPQNSLGEYMIFDKSTGIMLKAIYGINQSASLYKLTKTNMF